MVQNMTTDTDEYRLEHTMAKHTKPPNITNHKNSSIASLPIPCADSAIVVDIFVKMSCIKILIGAGIVDDDRFVYDSNIRR